MTMMNMMLSAISILISVAFYTILERKFLSYIQLRKGPNKVGFMGMVQPFSDAIKLFNKFLMTSDYSNSIMSYLSPPLSLMLALMIISIMPLYYYSFLDNLHNILLYLIISSMSVYSIIMIGWASNSKYAHLGTIRSIAQMISYEVAFFLILLSITILTSSFSFYKFTYIQNPIPFSTGFSIMLIMWIIACIAEVNRSPFDFAEGESELVSGFNVEYMGGWFAMIFLAEYTNMIILSIISAKLFLSINSMMFFMSCMLMMMLYLWTRGSYPRFRFDKLMYLNWKIILPLSLYIIITPILISLNY